MAEPRLNIAGIGLVGGFGQGKQSLLDALRNGGRPNGTVSVTREDGDHKLPAYQADVSGVIRFISAAAARRMNRFGKLALFGASMAVEDAGWPIPLKRKDVGLVIASGYGASKSTFDFLDSIIDEGGNFPSPTLFSNSVHSSAASHLSISLGLEGPCLTVSQFEMSPISALLTARDWLVEGRVEAVLFGSVDELCPVLGYCYDRFFGSGAEGPIEPFAWGKQTAVMGEGAAFVVLTLNNDKVRYGYIDKFQWTQARRAVIQKDELLVFGADGHTCCAGDYQKLSEGVNSKVAYSPVYGALPGGQLFDVIIAILAGNNKFTSVKCDSSGNCGIIECYCQKEVI
jgi:3-oxoacyl-[acyl-carrier-protein] synthase II